MIEVRGGEQLDRLARALKEAGDKGLQRELSIAINRALKPVKASVQRSASSTLPSRGGLAADVAGFKVQTRRGKGSVKLVSRGRYSGYHMDQGIIRHGPGNAVQSTRPGWWTQPTQAAAPEVRRELVVAMDEVARKIDRSA